MLKESDIEMVRIAAPNALHAQMTIDCAQGGKHIVCEKPLAMTIEEGEQMIPSKKQTLTERSTSGSNIPEQKDYQRLLDAALQSRVCFGNRPKAMDEDSSTDKATILR